MIILLSPAKKLDYDSTLATDVHTLPELMEQSELLINKLKKFSAKKISKMMDLSPALSDLNFERYQDWNTDFSMKNARQALLAFKGDVYMGMQVEKYNQKDFDYAQEHMRILSGLHGLLRPLDLIRPYRLEMGTKWAVTPKKNNLYKFWGTKIAESLNETMEKQNDHTILNLASGEYYKAVDKKALKADKIINVNFKDLKNGQYKAVFLWVKQARGLMASYIIRNRITDVEGLKGFSEANYYFSPEESTETDLVFHRDKPVLLSSL